MVGALPAQATTRDPIVNLDVVFTLTDLDYRPLAGVSGRLVIGEERGWQDATAGTRFVTAADGTFHVTLPATIAKRSRKVSTTLFESLFRRAEPTDYLQVAVELEYGGRQRLYVVQLHHFANGFVLQDAFLVFTPDSNGNFTQRSEYRPDGTWIMPDLGGLIMTTAGHQTWEFALRPDTTDPAGRRWKLDLRFKRASDPVRR